MIENFRPLVFFLISSIFQSIGHSQCTFDELFPIKTGMDKYDVLIKIATIEYLLPDKESNEMYARLASWEKPDYLLGDSIFREIVSYSFTYIPCIPKSNSKLILKFANKKLYSIGISSSFTTLNFEAWNSTYDKLFKMLEAKYPYATAYTSTLPSGDKVGESWKFTNTPLFVDDLPRNVDEIVDLSKDFDYEFIHSKGELIPTSNIRKYNLEIRYSDFLCCKISQKGY